MARQYVGVEFRPNSRPYSYHWDGDPVVPGDWVRVPDKSGDGWKKVRVVEVSGTKPVFDTKPILGPYVPEPPPLDLLSFDDAPREGVSDHPD